MVVAEVASVAHAFGAPHCGQVCACEYHPSASLTHLLPLHASLHASRRTLTGMSSVMCRFVVAITCST